MLIWIVLFITNVILAVLNLQIDSPVGYFNAFAAGLVFRHMIFKGEL